MTNPTWLYVAAVYAIAVWLGRRGGADLPWRVALFFYSVTLMFLWPVLTSDFTNYSVDVLKTLAPWGYLRREWYVVNSELNDLPFQLVPWAHQVRESWKALELPLWNHLSGGGYPLLGNGQSSAFSIIRFIALPLTLDHAISAEAAMKILIALTFTYLYCRGRRYSMLASVIGAVTFGFSGFIISWLHFAHVTVACMAPAVLYCIDRLIERRTYGRFVFAAFIGAGIVYAGHPESVAHLFLLAVGYVLWVLFVERPEGIDRKRVLATLAGSMVAGALLAAPFLFTLAEAVPRSMRVRERSLEPYQGTGYADLRCAVLLLQPHFFGQAPLELPWGPAQTEGLGGYAGVLAAASFVALLANAIATRKWRTREMFFVLATILSLGVIFNWPGVKEAIHFILPMAAHARVRFLLVLVLAVQTAAAIDLARRIPLLIGLLAVSATLLAMLHGADFPKDYWRDTAVLAMLPSLAVLALAALAVLTRRKELLLALLVAIVAELSLFGRDRNPFVTANLAYPRTPLIDKLDELLKKKPGRITGTGAMLYPNTQAVFGFEDMRLHDPMANQRYVDFLELTAGFEAKGRYHPNWQPWFEPTVLDFLNVRYIATFLANPMRDEQRFKLVYRGPDGYLFENLHVLPRFFAVRNVVMDFNPETFRRKLRHHTEWSSTAYLDELKLENRQMHDDFFHPRPPDSPLADARIVSSTPTDYRIHVSAPRWSLVVSSVPSWPGWRVERNGKRAAPIRVNAAFLGFAVPPGENDVRVYYAPWSFWGGAILALLTTLAIGIYGLAARARRYRRAPELA